MSGQVSALNATQAAGTAAMKDQARAGERRWGGRWTVTAWPASIDVDVNNPRYLGAWASLELEAEPPGRSYTVFIIVALVDDPTLLRIDASIDRPAMGCDIERVAEIAPRDVPLDEGPIVAVEFVEQICRRLEELLLSGGEPAQEPRR